ncbi:HrpB1 family type III secretion system apparatus protein [Ideonella sp. YS5]|uniref:HrpB1 family type III secretion system apparatus protein n=1 Tax=Ideonella sp. YS5 TaxID=3453714 RepID=UPI003EF08AAB
MNPKLDRKEFVARLIGLVSKAIDHDLPDDAASILAGVRVLRPRLLELDILEGWILIKRGEYKECIHLMRNLENSPTQWSLAKAMMASCQHHLKDSEWEVSANDVLNGDDPSDEALEMIDSLKKKKAPTGDTPAEVETASEKPFAGQPIPFDMSFMFHMRA